MATGDMAAFCYYYFDVCDAPPVIEIDESLYFSPKPDSANIVPQPSGECPELVTGKSSFRFRQDHQCTPSLRLAFRSQIRHWLRSKLQPVPMLQTVCYQQGSAHDQCECLGPGVKIWLSILRFSS